MSILDKFERKISGRGAIRAEKRLTLFISNEDTDDIMKMVEPLENLGLLTDSVTVTVKHEIKKTRRWISWCYDGIYGFFIDKWYHWKMSHKIYKRKKKWILPFLALHY